MYKCLIIDDEVPARALISNHLSKLPDFEVVQSFGNAIEAFIFLQQNEIDFRDFVGKLKYYRLGDFNDERSISLARILFPYYKQNPEHENLTHIGFAILAFPENLPESSVLNLYKLY